MSKTTEATTKTKTTKAAKATRPVKAKVEKTPKAKATRPEKVKVEKAPKAKKEKVVKPSLQETITEKAKAIFDFVKEYSGLNFGPKNYSRGAFKIAGPKVPGFETSYALRCVQGTWKVSLRFMPMPISHKAVSLNRAGGANRDKQAEMGEEVIMFYVNEKKLA